MATNTDVTLPTAPGHRAGQRHARRGGAQAATGADPIVVGKPDAPLYLLCAERLGVAVRRVLAVGDRLDTDIAGAVAAGMDSALVLTGVDSVTTLAAAPRACDRPTCVEDLRALAEPTTRLPRPTARGGVCGAARRRLVDGAVGGRGVGQARSRRPAPGVACLHEALDRGDLDEARGAPPRPEIDAVAVA